jgi:pilus assembly protein Flp/PilA
MQRHRLLHGAEHWYLGGTDMQLLRTMLSRVWKDEDGATMIEYALMVSLIAMAAFAGASSFGTALQQLYENIRDEIGAAVH